MLRQEIREKNFELKSMQVNESKSVARMIKIAVDILARLVESALMRKYFRWLQWIENRL